MIGTLCWICGILGAASFAICSLPQVIKAVKTKSTKDISLFFIVLSILGNIFSATYIFYTNYITGYWQIPQYFNYGIALTLIIVLLFLKIRYDKTVKITDKETKQITKELDIVYETLINPETVEEPVADKIEEQEDIAEDEKPVEEEPVEVDEKFELFKDKIDKIKIPVYSEDALRNSTIYARQQWLNYRSAMMDMINEPIDEYRLTRPILDRWEVSYIKEKLTNYDNILNEIDKKFGKNETYKKIHNLILNKIADTYPFLKNECQQQKM